MASTLLTRPSTWTAAAAIISLGIAASTYNHEARAAHASSAPLTFSSFTTLTLESSEQITHNVKRLRFALPTPTTTTSLPPISSLLTRHTPPGALLPVLRPYTPISTAASAADAGHITLLVKRYPRGRASPALHALRPGDRLAFKALPDLAYQPGQARAIACLAAGTGITPVYQLVRAVLRDPGDQTRLTLVYANDTPADVLLKEEFDALRAEHPERLRVVYLVRRGGDPEKGLRTGVVTAEVLREVLPPREGAVKVLVSGPPAMTAALAGPKGGFGWTQGPIGGVLMELGYTKEDVHKF